MRVHEKPRAMEESTLTGSTRESGSGRGGIIASGIQEQLVPSRAGS